MKKFLIPLKKKRDEPESSSSQPKATSSVTVPVTSEPEPGTSSSCREDIERRPSTKMNSGSSDSPDTEEEKGKSGKRRSKSYLHKYNPSWEKDADFRKWIGPSKQGINHFTCNVCFKDYIGGIAAVKKHNLSSKHIKKMNAIVLQPSVTQSTFNFFSRRNIIKQNEIKISAFIAEHNLPINVSDHLTELVKSIISSGIEPNEASQISCDRTKCTAIINNVIGNFSFENLVEILKIKNFSLLVDESTDNSGEKKLALVVRFIDNNDFKAKDEFLGLIPVSDASAQNLYNVIVNFFTTNQIPYKTNLIGFGADGANAMMGNKHSLKTLLEKDVNDLFVLKCVCHSLALCASYACEKIPDDVEKLIRDLFSHMQNSFKRQTEFRTFQTFLNIKINKLLHPSQTRWLSLSAAVNRVLVQFDALVLYFRAEVFDNKTLGAKEIYNQLTNPATKLYLQFLEYILPTFNDLNLEFQSENPKIHLLYTRMASCYRLLLSYYIKPDYLKNTDDSKLQYRNPNHFLPLDKIYLGPKVTAALSNKILSKLEEDTFRKNCLSFYIEAANQIYKRFSFNSREMVILKMLSFLNPSEIQSTESLGPIGVKFPSIIQNLNELDREFRLLKNSQLNFELDDISFWKEVSKLKKGDGTLAFPELIKVVSMFLSLPHSSACVERVFSTINLNKTKLRNRLGANTLSGLLHTKRCIKKDGKECYNFEIPPQMISKHNNDMYKLP